jgi:hypothetical protein
MQTPKLCSLAALGGPRTGHHFVFEIVIRRKRVAAQERQSQMDEPGTVTLRLVENRANQRAVRTGDLRESFGDTQSCPTIAAYFSRFNSRTACTAPSALVSVAAAIRIPRSFGYRFRKSSTNWKLLSRHSRAFMRTRNSAGIPGSRERMASNAPVTRLCTSGPATSRSRVRLRDGFQRKGAMSGCRRRFLSPGVESADVARPPRAASK